MFNFRDLKKEEISVLPCKFKANSISFLLHKSSRVDMNILDETVGSENWQNDFYLCRDTLICRIGIKCNENWIWKSNSGDVDDPSFEAKKTETTDAFKRAGTMWGIGRELYTMPVIEIPADNVEFSSYNGEPYLTSKLFVSKLKIQDKVITYLELSQNIRGNDVVVYTYSPSSSPCSSSVNPVKSRNSAEIAEASKASKTSDAIVIPETKEKPRIEPEEKKMTDKTFVKPVENKPIESEKTDEKELTLEEALSIVYPFNSKCKGMTLRQVAAEDPQTIRWLADVYGGNKNRVKEAAIIILNSLT